jgi:hypothetical protein
MPTHVAEVLDGIVTAVAPASASNGIPDPVDPAKVLPGELLRVACGDNVRPGDTWGPDGFAAPAAPAAPAAEPAAKPPAEGV